MIRFIAVGTWYALCAAAGIMLGGMTNGWWSGAPSVSAPLPSPVAFVVDEIGGATPEQSAAFRAKLLAELAERGAHDKANPRKLRVSVWVAVGEPVPGPDGQEWARSITLVWRVHDGNKVLGRVTQWNWLPPGMDPMDAVIRGAAPAAASGIAKLL